MDDAPKDPQQPTGGPPPPPPVAPPPPPVAPPPPPAAPPPPSPPAPPPSAAPQQPRFGAKGSVEHALLPVGRSGLAIAAGYLGLLSIIPFVHLAALLTGVLALRDIAEHTEKAGRGRAWLGIVLGGTFTAVYGWAVLVG